MIDELALVAVVAAAIALISCLSIEPRRRVRRLPRGAWVAVIMLVPLAGPVAWFVLGRPRRLSVHQPIQHLIFRRPAPPAPDDDPEFLRSLEDERRPGGGTEGAAGPPGPAAPP